MKKFLIVSSCLIALVFSAGFSGCHNYCRLDHCHKSYLADVNPRGQQRPQDGRGGGQGMRGGHGGSRNQGPCDNGGPGYGRGGGRGGYRQ